MSMQYGELLQSLSAGAKTTELHGVPLEVRSCGDRECGCMDPRSAETVLATREEFRANKRTFHKELQNNEDKLFGAERPEFNADPVNAMRFQFGWRSTDLSEGVTVRHFEIGTGNGTCPVWGYEVPSENRERPCLVFLHGGAFVAGDTATVENQCKLLAQLSGAVVLSVDYPLAPEHPYPAGFEACYNAVKWAHEHAEKLGISRGKLAVAGDSAGGNLALACALRDRDEGTSFLCYQALIYPFLSWSPGPDDRYYYWSEEQYENSEQNAVIAQQIRFVGSLARDGNAWYIPQGTDRFHPYVSPIAGECHGLPNTLLMTAEYDFLRAECDAYLVRLASVGVPVRAIRYGGIFHGTFDRLGYAPQVEDMLREIAKDLKAL